MESQDSRFLIVDGTNIFWRAYHGLLSQHFEHGGKPTWGIYGTVNTIATALRHHRPTHTIVTFDYGKSEFRLSIWPKYKAGRPGSEFIDFEDANNQLGRAEGLLPLFGVRTWKEKGIEADDLIATLVDDFKDKVQEIVILSGDKDMKQLVDENVSVVHPSLGKKEEIRWDLQAVVDTYGVLPSRLPEIWALSGDKTDNIPGVPGVGEKTAIKLIQKYGNVSMVALSEEKKVQGYTHDIKMSLQLVRLYPDLARCPFNLNDILFTPVSPTDTDGKVLDSSLHELGFDSLSSRWKDGSLWVERGRRLRDLKPRPE